MNSATAFDMERSIARCRVFLSLIASFVLYIDPTNGGVFAIGLQWAAVLVAHLAYSTALWYLQQMRPSPRLAQIATVGDVLFVAAVATVTEGTTSPFFMFFSFAVLSVGIRSGLRPALLVTLVSVVLYFVLVVLRAPGHQTLYLTMRAAYISVTGYLIGYFGQERLKQDAVIRQLEAGAERERIARSLHDGYAAALAGINLRLEAVRELFRRGIQDEALAELVDLQGGVNREHDELRAYIRSLIELDTSAPTGRDDGARVAVRADLEGSAGLVEHVLLIMLEGTRNVRRHARARSASIVARMAERELVISIDDDGVGFREDAVPPWSIVSRVVECGGEITLPRDGRPGGHVLIQLPAA
jgi:signal transduction histidine kinase